MRIFVKSYFRNRYETFVSAIWSNSWLEVRIRKGIKARIRVKLQFHFIAMLVLKFLLFLETNSLMYIGGCSRLKLMLSRLMFHLTIYDVISHKDVINIISIDRLQNASLYFLHAIRKFKKLNLLTKKMFENKNEKKERRVCGSIKRQ